MTGFLTPVLGGVAAVAAIILLTVAVRAVLVPLSFRAMRGQAVQARLAPQLQALRTRYAKQPERLQREMTALYQREGTSLFAGITPLLLQWPLLSVVYILFRSPQVAGKPNVLLSHDLLGVSARHALAERRRRGQPAGPGLPGRLRRAGRPVLAVGASRAADDRRPGCGVARTGRAR